MTSRGLRILVVSLTVVALVALVWVLALAIDGSGDDGPAPWATRGAPNVTPQPISEQ
jgi:ABC-type transporter Mla subunit MlaD